VVWLIGWEADVEWLEIYLSLIRLLQLSKISMRMRTPYIHVKINLSIHETRKAATESNVDEEGLVPHQTDDQILHQKGERSQILSGTFKSP
jgi:hypothetical protein